MTDFNTENSEEELMNSILFNLKQNGELIDKIVGDTLNINVNNNELSQILEKCRIHS